MRKKRRKGEGRKEKRTGGVDERQACVFGAEPICWKLIQPSVAGQSGPENCT
jgi:hypothetical protein